MKGEFKITTLFDSGAGRIVPLFGFYLQLVGGFSAGLRCAAFSVIFVFYDPWLITSPFTWNWVHLLSPEAVTCFLGSVPPWYCRDSVWTWVLVDLVMCTLESSAFFFFCKLLVFLYFVSSRITEATLFSVFMFCINSLWVLVQHFIKMPLKTNQLMFSNLSKPRIHFMIFIKSSCLRTPDLS